MYSSPDAGGRKENLPEGRDQPQLRAGASQRAWANSGELSHEFTAGLPDTRASGVTQECEPFSAIASSRLRASEEAQS